MSALATTIAALGILSTAVELVPIIGPNLKAAIELASKVCEKVEVRESALQITVHSDSQQTIRGNREGYEHLGNTVGRLLMAVSSVLQRVEPEKLGVLQASFAHLMEYVTFSVPASRVYLSGLAASSKRFAVPSRSALPLVQHPRASVSRSRAGYVGQARTPSSSCRIKTRSRNYAESCKR
jgi:hypothetical protein